MSWTAPRTWTANDELTAALMNAQLRDNLNAAFPVGSFHYFMQAGTSVETTINGFALETNGVAVSRTTYSSLNSLCSGLSYPFGTGDGSTTFNLPDTRGRILIHMAASGNADVNAIGDNDGVALASRTPHHTTSSAGAHSHTVSTAATANSAGTALSPATSTSEPSQTTSSAGAHTHGPGGSTPNDLVPWIVGGTWAVKY